MQENPLQQLRDVHPPLEPGWWPPAPGWWLVAIICIIAVAYIVFSVWLAYRRRRPIRNARVMLDDLLTEYQSGRIDTLTYVNNANEILKRLLVIALGIKSLAAVAGTDWLKALDRITSSKDFSAGHGCIMGNSRFAADATANVTALHESLRNLLANTHPTRTPKLFAEAASD